MAIPRFAWGIDVGNRALKAIKLVRDGDSFRIDDFEVIEHEQILSQAGDNREPLIQTSLANFAQRHPGKGGVVAIGVSGQQSFARFVKLPPVEPSKIAEIVKFEAMQQIPFPLDDVEWSYQLFQTPDSPEVEVGIFAMRRELVNQTIKYFSDVGLEVNVVQMNPLAVYNGLHFDNRLDSGATMIIDIGAENSDLIIAESENMWMRSVPVGGNNFTEALVQSFKLKFPKAEEMKRNAATSKYGRQILQGMKPVFSDLVSEIQRSIGFYSSTHRDSRITKVLALGGTFRLPGLQKYLQQNLQLEVVRIDRLEAPMPAEARFAATFNENILSSIGAYGLAVQAMGKAKITSSLLPEKIRRERMWKSKTPWFALAAMLFVAGTAVPIVKLKMDQMAFENKEPVRTEIKSQVDRARRLDLEWKKIETSGDEDRKQISNYMNLLSTRGVNIGICNEIGRAFPEETAADLAKPRAQRESVSLVGWATSYQTNVEDLLALSGDEFNMRAERVEMAQAGAGPGGPGGIGGYSVTPPAPSAQAGPTAPHRGFLLTLLCRTPNVDPTPLVSRTVAVALRNRSYKGANPPPGFSIERVTIPSKVKFSTMFPNGLTHARPAPLFFFPPPDANEQQPAGFIPPAPPQPQNGAASGPPVDPFGDPAHNGESFRDDSLVTVLAVIMIDPPKKEVAEK